MDYEKMFTAIRPGFFQQPRIMGLPDDDICTELTMDLHTVEMPVFPCPAHITFGMYHGPLAPLREAVAEVNEGWVGNYTENTEAFCAFDGEKIVSFCIVEKMGEVDGLVIGGPGCVGTVPAYRRQGIGIEMVRRATEILKDRGCDISWIHWTHVQDWYSKLGYKIILKWNNKGFVPMA